MQKEEIIIQTENVKVRVIALQPAETAPLHHHSEVTDSMFGISGEILVRLQDPAEEVLLTPGTRCTVAPGRLHQVINRLPKDTSEYLLIQGGGSYDLIKQGT